MKRSIRIVAIALVGAVAATLFAVLAGPSLLAPRQPTPQDLILYNGTILTMQSDHPEAEAIAVVGDRIRAIGTDEEVLPLRTGRTVVVDLRGRTLMPGFIDSHAHWIGDRAVADLPSAEAAIQSALEGGWTSINELFVNQERLDELIGLDQGGRLRLRVNAYLPLSWQFERFGEWYKAYEPGHEYSSQLRIGGVKIFVDNGSDLGQTVFFTQDELNALVADAHHAGFQIAIHTMADAGLDLVLNAYENALGGSSNAEHRHRIEHLGVVRDDQMARIHDLGLIASFQLTWFDSEPGWVEDVNTYIGAERTSLVGRWRDILAAGIPAIGSTDFPWIWGTNGSAIAAVSEAVTRVGEGGLPPAPWMLNETITVDQALRLLTIDAAYGTFQEGVKGSLAVGKLADLVVLSENPLAIPPEQIKEVRVLLTVVGGRGEVCVDYTSLCTKGSNSARGSSATNASGAQSYVPLAAATVERRFIWAA